MLGTADQERIIEYLNANPESTHTKIANTLGLSDFDVIGTLSGMVKRNFVRLTVLPLGNSISPDQSDFYSSARQNVTVFRNIRTTSDLINYLRSPDRLANSEYLYHYTRLESFIRMCNNKMWLLSRADKMNDLLEYQNGDKERWKNIFLTVLWLKTMRILACGVCTVNLGVME